MVEALADIERRQNRDITYSLVCGAWSCRHNIGEICVKSVERFGHDTLALDHTGRCLTYERRNGT